MIDIKLGNLNISAAIGIACLLISLSCSESVFAGIPVAPIALGGNVMSIAQGATEVETFKLADFGFDYIHHTFSNYSPAEWRLIHHRIHPLMNTSEAYESLGRSEGKAFAYECASALLEAMRDGHRRAIHSFAPHFAFRLLRQKNVFY